MADDGLVRIGDMPMLKDIQKKHKPLTRAQLEREAAATEVRDNRAGIQQVFMARQLVQCTLPHSDPGDVPVWHRENGRVTLAIQPGWDTVNSRSFGIPYGVIPRLVLFWIVTEVKRTRKRRLELGDSLSGFLREVGLSPKTGRGKRSIAPRLRKQMTRLFECRIIFRGSVRGADGAQGTIRKSLEVAPEAELWWDPKRPNQAALWPSWILLGEYFYESILISDIPADMRALKALKRSPLCLDLYVWAGYKVHEVNENNRPMTIPWEGLMAQLGVAYDPKDTLKQKKKRIENFKRKVKAALEQVARFFPKGLKIVYGPYALTFYPGSALAVPELPA